ncbi:penicillin-binding protein [Streptomyces sp. WAC05374]|uniref:transglycosylase domain-containing protein n=1 Tax=Streptomyces sp. WAC05374 TaxID=2487420 RepID=UPI000F8861B0|nr:transglycosylase domain-containing protein [Streptomyces sp. WAC05374]RST12349.1 penicillin-binding protein [Streptomyces sp. WAC05374]TDF44335.1 penicillin-binding protein [Streptomyces sp. WAC05374]TDF53735.1 penicillin-binding protein [Streptomyces sp. WAC05374]TDF58568.1 penicillin-binding protein [Streptomyces sp. WAC05374]
MSDEPSQPGWEPRDPTVAGTPGGKPARPDGKKPKRKRRTGWRRLVPTWRMVLGAFLLTALLLIGGFFAGYQLVDIPAANAAATAQSNVYLYRDGTPLAQKGDVNRENVRLSQVPLPVRRAVLAAEDRDFYSQPGVDPEAMLRAAWNTLTGKGTQGGSTITQQYVKNYYLGQERTLVRKVKEFFISIKLDREKTKDDILEGYLNTSFYGRNAYGIQAAARAYYGRDAQDLTAAQGAYLAVLLNAPSAYDVDGRPDMRAKAVGRWNYVLDAMVQERWLTPAARAATAFPEPEDATATTGLSGQRGYIVQAVEDYLTAHDVIDKKTLAQGGYRITTTLDQPKQEALVEAVADQVTARLDPANETDRYVRVGGVSVDPATGKVVAMYGGVDYTRQFVNNATRRDYQVGSTFKPFVFAAAIDNASVTQDGDRILPNTRYDGTNKRQVQGWGGHPYSPANEDDVDYGPITVRTATDKSVNAVYAQLAVDVGPAKVEQTAIDLGLPADTPDLNPSPSIALGPATASVLDMAGAYATLANHGKHGRYALVERIEKDGRTLPLPAAKSEQVISREAADTTTAMLRSVIEGGTGTAAQAAGRPAAGKTGTAEDDKAAWFAGYTPDLATVITVMGQDPDTGAQKPLYGALGLERMNGGGAPAEIWGQYTRAALAGSAVRDFDLVLAEGADEEPPEEEPWPGEGDTEGPDGWNEGGDQEGMEAGRGREGRGRDDGDDGYRGGPAAPGGTGGARSTGGGRGTPAPGPGAATAGPAAAVPAGPPGGPAPGAPPPVPAPAG